MNLEQIDAELRHLEEIERTITDELTVTNSYMPQVYELRQHIDFVAGKLKERQLQLQVQARAAVQPPANTPGQDQLLDPGNGDIKVQA